MRKFIHQAVNTKASRGFTLLEALIALLVLSIGLLGLAGLQASSARLGHEAHMRSITTMAASEIIEKIRMRTAKISRKVRPAVIGEFAAASGDGTDCDPAISSIQNDFDCWQKSIGNQLPDGAGRIVDDNGADGFVEIQISWYDRESEQPSTVSWSFFVGENP